MSLHNDGLPTYSQNNELIRGERVECDPEPIWQYKNVLGEWLDSKPIRYDEYETFEDYSEDSKVWSVQTRRIYRQVAIKEEKSEGYNETIHPLFSSAQPVKEGEEVICSQPKKTATEIWVHQHLLNEGWEQNKFGVISAEFNGGSCNLTYVIAHVLDDYLAAKQPVIPPASKDVKSVEEIIDGLPYQMYGGAKRYLTIHIVQAMNAFAAQHQQSEGMVEVGTLKNIISAIQSFTITGDVEPDEDLYNQGLERGVKEIEKVIRQLTQNDKTKSE